MPLMTRAGLTSLRVELVKLQEQLSNTWQQTTGKIQLLDLLLTQLSSTPEVVNRVTVPTNEENANGV